MVASPGLVVYILDSELLFEPHSADEAARCPNGLETEGHLIFLMNGIIIFYIVEFGRLLCPNFDKARSLNKSINMRATMISPSSCDLNAPNHIDHLNVSIFQDEIEFLREVPLWGNGSVSEFPSN